MFSDSWLGDQQGEVQRLSAARHRSVHAVNGYDMHPSVVDQRARDFDSVAHVAPKSVDSRHDDPFCTVRPEFGEHPLEGGTPNSLERADALIGIHIQQRPATGLRERFDGRALGAERQAHPRLLLS